MNGVFVACLASVVQVTDRAHAQDSILAVQYILQAPRETLLDADRI